MQSWDLDKSKGDPGVNADSDQVSIRDAVEPLILAIDVGTSSARALVYDCQGRPVQGMAVHRPYNVTATSDGGVEIDPRMLLDLVLACVDDVACALDRAKQRVSAVACDTFWHSVMGVDRHGEQTTAILTWADTRSRDAARRLQQRLDDRAVHARTGAVLHSSYLPAKLAWLRASRAELFKDSVYWMSFAEFMYMRLFGERRVSISMASATGLFDQTSCQWDAELIDVLGLTDGSLSPIFEFTERFVRLKPPYVERWPALSGVPWYLALGDGACNNVGSGGSNEDRAVAMIGTSGALRVVYQDDRLRMPWGLWTYRVDRPRFVSGGALSDGGNVFAWLVKTFRLDAVDILERELLEMAPDSHGLTMLPFLAGERSPDWNVDATAALVGMRLDTTALQIARAALESIAYRFALIYDALAAVVPIRRGIIGSGVGLIHSPVWMQIMTDVLGQPLVASAASEASSRGAALLVLESMGAIGNVQDIPAPLGTKYAPDKARGAVYRAAMERQTRLYDRLIKVHLEDEASVAPASSRKDKVGAKAPGKGELDG